MESESLFISTPQKLQKRQSFGSSGCDLRPLRLTKQRNRNSIISNSSNSPSGTPTTPSFDSPSRKGSLPTNEEFHCRPIRLGEMPAHTLKIDTTRYLQLKIDAG